MAVLTVTAANVLASGTGQKTPGVAGATLTAGQPLYADASSGGVLKPAVANSATGSDMVGVSLHAALTGQPIMYVTSDVAFTHGLSGVVAGDIVILSATAGSFSPSADLASTWYTVVAIICTSATQGILKITRSTVVKA
jgi:hypothetical protein